MTLSELVRPGHLADAGTTFTGREGPVPLWRLFAGRRRLAVHHTVPEGVATPGASADDLPAVLRDPETRLVLVFRAPFEMLEQYRRHLGHDLPCYSAPGGGSADDAWDQVPVLSLFHRDGADVVHTTTIPLPGPGFLADALDVLGAHRAG
ncbi:DUF899 family protein [Amycolatopsis sp. cmx-4-68]|uniref:DUF899 family protein n=1 Tax=Amycolatopsis sp. cmx-4-68 TaxID=2790938 RepID=UPI00397DDB76